MHIKGDGIKERIAKRLKKNSRLWRVISRLRYEFYWLLLKKDFKRIKRIEKQLNKIEKAGQERPVIFFDGSSSISRRFSLNLLFGLLSSWVCRINGQPVMYAVCSNAMKRCLLGTDWRNPTKPPPCKNCIRFKSKLYPADKTLALEWKLSNEIQLRNEFNKYNMEELINFKYNGLPLGEIVLPSVKWALRKARLDADAFAREVAIDYIISCINLIPQMNRMLEESQPKAVVLFNGIFYPEALFKYLARAKGIRTVTYEAGYQPLSAFFSHREATAWDFDYPAGFTLSEEQHKQIDAYLEQRFQGNFTMAGIRFWQDMTGLTPEVLKKIGEFKQLISIFTNTPFDTSQVHVNSLFKDMFEWLDCTLELIRKNPQTLFVIRAHPDELRPGKENRQTIFDWLENRQALQLPNLLFISSREYMSSYELIRRSKFCLVYNSTIGMEAAILGKPVICASNTKQKRANVGIYPCTKEEYRLYFSALLNGRFNYDTEYQSNLAKQFIYYLIFKTSLDFSHLLSPGFKSTVSIRDFNIELLKSENSATARIIYEGITKGEPFIN